MKQLLNLKGVRKLNSLCMLFIIINHTDEKKLINIINKFSIGFKFVMHGKGTASSSVLEYFGLNDEEKTIITLILPPIICKHLLKEIESKLKERGKGIAFSIPLSSGTKYMLDFYQKHEMEDIDMNETNHELIVTIVNEGHAEKVMNEAKKGGATGGTVIKGRGLESEQAIKFLKISIEPEKDIVIIIVPTEKKQDIMNLIVKNCGLKTAGAGICFSLPIDQVVGLREEKTKV